MPNEAAAGSSNLPPVTDACHPDLARGPDDAELHALLVIVVGAVLRIGDADVDIEPAGEKLNPLDREAHDPLGLDRRSDAIDQRVRAEHPDPVVPVEVHAKDRVGHSLRIAIADLDRGRLARLEHAALPPLRAKPPRAPAPRSLR